MAGPSLTQRLEEVMAAQQWDRQDLMRVSGASSGLVSAWLGKVGKTGRPVKSMGISWALKIEHASGFAAPWIAEGVGPKMAPKDRRWPFEDITLAELSALSERQLGALEMGMRDTLEKLGLREPRDGRRSPKGGRQ